MKKVRYGIGFFCAAAVMAWGYGKSFHLSEEKRQKELIEQKIQQSEGAVSGCEGNLALRYIAKEENGYVNVYLEDGTLYEVTGIRTDSFPGELREELKNGKMLEGSRALYSFLENYSS